MPGDGPSVGHEPEADADSSPPPRAFAQGTGVVLQTVGVILTIVSCCTCVNAGGPTLSSGEVQSKLGQASQPTIDLAKLIEDPARLGLAMMVAFATLGGVGMAALGLGLQSDKPRSAGGAVFTTGALLITQLVAGVLLWTGGGSWGSRIWNLLLVLIVALLFGFCITAWREHKKHPPPRGIETLPPDFEPPRFMH